MTFLRQEVRNWIHSNKAVGIYRLYHFAHESSIWQDLVRTPDFCLFNHMEELERYGLESSEVFCSFTHMVLDIGKIQTVGG